MGLFGFGKNKKEKQQKAQEQNINQAFLNNGGVTNATQAPQNRKETLKGAEIAKQQAVKKDQLVEGLKNLHKFVYSNPDLSDYDGKLFDVINKLKRMPEGLDPIVTTAIDNFIQTAIRDGINYCNRNSWVGMGACIDVIEDLINDRLSGGEWFKNADYLNARLTQNKLYAIIKDKEAEIAKIQTRGAELKAKFEDPRFKNQQQSLYNEMLDLKNRREALKTEIDNRYREKQNIDKIVNTIKNSLISKDIDTGYNVVDNFDSVLEMTETENQRTRQAEMMGEKMNSMGVKHTDSTLTVNDNLSNDVAATVMNVDDLGF